jgi:hypothetical protein
MKGLGKAARKTGMVLWNAANGRNAGGRGRTTRLKERCVSRVCDCRDGRVQNPWHGAAHIKMDVFDEITSLEGAYDRYTRSSFSNLKAEMQRNYELQPIGSLQLICEKLYKVL